MREYLWPVILIATGILLFWISVAQMKETESLGFFSFILILIGAGWCLLNITKPKYVETERYMLQSYSLTTIDTRQEQARRCTAVLQDGSTMIVDLKEIRKEGGKPALVQYSDMKNKINPFKMKSYYILFLPVDEPEEQAPQKAP